MSKSRPVIVIMSILAGLQILAAGAALADVVGMKTAALFVLAVAAAQGGMQFYVQSVVTPVQDVVAYRDKSGTVVPGQLANDPDRAQEAVEVLITPAAEDVDHP